MCTPFLIYHWFEESFPTLFDKIVKYNNFQTESKTWNHILPKYIWIPATESMRECSWMPQYSWNIAKVGIKHEDERSLSFFFIFILTSSSMLCHQYWSRSIAICRTYAISDNGLIFDWCVCLTYFFIFSTFQLMFHCKKTNDRENNSKLQTLTFKHCLIVHEM